MNHKSIMNKGKIKIGSRSSRLAVVQVDEILSMLAREGINLDHERRTFMTAGDKDKTTSLTSDPGDDFFTDTLDQALLNHEIDMTIHSAKDLPEQMHEGLSIFALTAPLDDTDAFIGRTKFADLPPCAKIGTSSLVRQEGIKDLNPELVPVDIRGSIEERIKLFKEGKYDGIIVATCALKRLGLEQEITDIFPWESNPLQGQLAVVGRADDFELRKIFSPLDIRKKYGRVTLVGAGPGDPELITLKAVNVLKKADCVFYDYLTNKALLDHAPQAEKIYAGKRKGQQTLSQPELSKLLRQKAMAGKNVVRLKGGDPLIFGRGAEEMVYLRSYHIRVDVIPGISSAAGIPSSLGIPLTARGISSSVAFVSGHEQSEQGGAPKPVDIPLTDTVVFLMGLTKLNVIVQSLLKAGWQETTPVIVISKGTTIEEKIVLGTVKDIQQKVEKEHLLPPGLVVAGQTVKFFNKKSCICGESILYLGTYPEKYKSLGKIIHHPMLEISPASLEDRATMQLIDDLKFYAIILLTSRFAVRYFFEFLQKHGVGMADLKAGDFVVIGRDTANELEQNGVTPKIIAREETGVGVVKALDEAYDLKGKKILFPRSSLPNPYIKKKLTQRGAQVTELTVYQNTKPQKRDLPQALINKILFTSPSTVKNFLEDYGSIPEEWQILSKGPKTGESLKAAGYQSEILVFE